MKTQTSQFKFHQSNTGSQVQPNDRPLPSNYRAVTLKITTQYYSCIIKRRLKQKFTTTTSTITVKLWACNWYYWTLINMTKTLLMSFLDNLHLFATYLSLPAWCKESIHIQVVLLCKDKGRERERVVADRWLGEGSDEGEDIYHRVGERKKRI